VIWARASGRNKGRRACQPRCLKERSACRAGSGIPSGKKRVRGIFDCVADPIGRGRSAARPADGVRHDFVSSSSPKAVAIRQARESRRARSPIRSDRAPARPVSAEAHPTIPSSPTARNIQQHWGKDMQKPGRHIAQAIGRRKQFLSLHDPSASLVLRVVGAICEAHKVEDARARQSASVRLRWARGQREDGP